MRAPISDYPPQIVRAIEQRMRPGRLSESGFLDDSERLIDVVDRDLGFLGSVGIMPTQIADSLETVVALAFRVLGALSGSRTPEGGLWNPGVRIEPWELRGVSWHGTQACPFVSADGVVCHGESHASWDFSLMNIRKQKFLTFPGLAIHLIREHSFFEGNVPHRVDPLVACEVLEVERGNDYSAPENRYFDPENLAECILENRGRSGVRSDRRSRRANERVGLPIGRPYLSRTRCAVERLKDRFQRHSFDDPNFGRLEHCRHSLWCGHWLFPPSGTKVSILLAGDRRGPSPGIRDFFEALPDRFDSILSTLRPRLDEIFRCWMQRPLGESVWDDLELSRLECRDPSAQPPEWNMNFELSEDEQGDDNDDGGHLWITVSLVGDSPQAAIVDTSRERLSS